MSQATELIAKQMAQAANVKKVWGTIIFNVKDLIYAGGAVGNGTIDDTSAVQAAVNDAVSKNATLVFFPPGTYKVTALTNTSTINFVGDNATFVGYVGSITEFGMSPINTKNTITPIYNVTGYGAKGDGVTDDAVAINNALQAAYSAGGGIVYAPQGIYLLKSQITIRKGVTLEGCGVKAAPRWVAATALWDETYFGTVFAIGWGSGLSGVENAAVLMSTFSSIIGCCFWYPNQLGSTANPTQYPPTISTVASDPEEANSFVNSPTVRNCLFINPWIAMDFTNPHQTLTVEDVQGTAWSQFIRINQSYDVDRLTDIQLNANFSYKGMWPGNNILSYHLTAPGNCAAFEIGKADSIYISRCFSYGFHRGMWIHTMAGLNPSGVFIEGCGFEGANLPFIVQNSVRRIKVSNVQVGSNIGGNGADAIYINLDPSSAISEIILENISSFQSNGSGLYLYNVNFASIHNLSLYSCCQTNPGFGLSGINIGNVNSLTLRDCVVEVAGGTNNLATNVVFSSVNGFNIDTLYLFGQTKAGGSPEFYVGSGTHGRIQKTFISASSAGSHVVQLGTVTDVTITDTIVY